MEPRKEVDSRRDPEGQGTEEEIDCQDAHRSPLFKRAGTVCLLPNRAVSSITFATAFGWDKNGTWLALISVVFAPARFAQKRSRSGLMARSFEQTMYNV